MRFVLTLLLISTLSACHQLKDKAEPDTTPKEIRSGFAFLTPESQALQRDEFANPGLLWVEKGKDLFTASEHGTPSCQSCHQDQLAGAAARFPKIDEISGSLVNIEGQINLCRTRHQRRSPLAYESDELLSLTAYLAHQSYGFDIQVSETGQAAKHYESGRKYFYTKRGQFNFSCAQCHNENWGRKLRGDTISQGHLNGFPAYRLEWQSLGSSHRRLRDCDTGVRAAPLPFGDQQYIDVELYLAVRASQLKLESPAVRR